jgi:glycine hydroxymethyltransferase
VITDPDFIKQRGITMPRFSEILEKNGMIIDREGRIGTSEISRYGFSSLDEIADLISRAMEGKDVKRDVLELKSSLKRVY